MVQLSQQVVVEVEVFAFLNRLLQLLDEPGFANAHDVFKRRNDAFIYPNLRVRLNFAEAVFFVAANLGGTSRGILGLLCFIGGLLLMNTAMTASASGIFAGSVHRPRVQGVVTLLTAAYSFAIGLIFIFGASDRLPALVR